MGYTFSSNLSKLKDSKKIPFKKRILLSEDIKKNSIYSVGVASVEEIYRKNILNASLLSMQRALEGLKFKPTIAYIDGIFAPKMVFLPQKVCFSPSKFKCYLKYLEFHHLLTHVSSRPPFQMFTF